MLKQPSVLQFVLKKVSATAALHPLNQLGSARLVLLDIYIYNNKTQFSLYILYSVLYTYLLFRIDQYGHCHSC